MSLATAATLLPLHPDAAVLDIGISTGIHSALLAVRGAHIWGIDPSPEMLARCAAQHPDFPRASGSFTAIRHPGATFDAATASFAFHEVPPHERAIACAELARILRPGGTLCLLDIIFASPATTNEARTRLAGYGDPDEDYPLVGDLDTLLRDAGLGATRWQQTPPCHWLCWPGGTMRWRRTTGCHRRRRRYASPDDSA